METTFSIEKLISNSGPVDITRFKTAKVKALYFPAHWCPPCQSFTPILANFYKKVNKSQEQKEIEIVFVSADESEKEFREYYKEMPWLAVPFGDNNTINDLEETYQVEGIPSLVIVDENMKMLRREGCSDLNKNRGKPKKVLKLWKSLYYDAETRGEQRKDVFKSQQKSPEKMKVASYKSSCLFWPLS